MTTDHVQDTIQLADGSLMPSDTQLGVENIPSALTEVKHLYYIDITPALCFALKEDVDLLLN